MIPLEESTGSYARLYYLHLVLLQEISEVNVAVMQGAKDGAGLLQAQAK